MRNGSKRSYRKMQTDTNLKKKKLVSKVRDPKPILSQTTPVENQQP